MLSRFKAIFGRYKKGVKREKDETEHELDVPAVQESLTGEVQEKRIRVAEFLEPIQTNWDFIEKTLLWKNALPACICFFFISGVFWKFISIKLRKIALIFGGFLLANGLSSDMRSASWDFCTRNFNLQTQGDPVLQFNFDDVCLFVATSWTVLAKAMKSFQELSRECPPKFYCILSVSLFSLLALFTYFPVIEFIYIAICVMFFYPAMHYYGIMDRLHARAQRLTAPIVKHWENNRTKRTRPALISKLPNEQEQLYDSDDEFILEKNQFTAKVLSSVVPDDDVPRDIDSERGTDDEKTSDEISNPDFENDFFTESQFEENLTMPSMSNFDSLMEPYDEFHSGLKFPDYTDSSRMDTLNILDAAANNVDTDDEMDDLPYEPEIRRLSNEEDNIHVSNERTKIRQPNLQAHAYSIPVGKSHDVNPDSCDIRTSNEPDLSDEEVTNVIEAGFEFLDHSDVEAESDIPVNDQPANDEYGQLLTSYTESGIATVSKWLGYQ